MASIAYGSFLLFIFSIPWEGVVRLPGVGTGSRIVGMIALPLCLLAIIMRGRAYLWWPIGLLALFVALAALSLSWTPDIEGGVVVIQTYLQLLVMTWLATQMIDGETELHGAFMAYVLGGYVAAVEAIRAYQSGSYEKYLRYAAEGMDPNDVACILSVAIAMAGYLAVCRRGWWRLLSLAYLPLGVYGVLLSASRAGFLAMLIAISMPIVLMLRSRHFGKVILFGTIGLVGGGMLLTQYVPESSWNRIATIGSEVSEGTLNGRLVIWDIGLDMINEAPLLGVGIGGYHKTMQRMVGWSQFAHNAFLSIAVQHGMVGLLIMVAAWVLIIRNILSMPPRERRAWYLILAVLLMAAMSLSWEGQKTAWLLVAMAMVHARYAQPPPLRPSAVMEPALASVTAGRSVRALPRS